MPPSSSSAFKLFVVPWFHLTKVPSVSWKSATSSLPLIALASLTWSRLTGSRSLPHLPRLRFLLLRLSLGRRQQFWTRLTPLVLLRPLLRLLRRHHLWIRLSGHFRLLSAVPDGRGLLQRPLKLPFLRLLDVFPVPSFIFKLDTFLCFCGSLSVFFSARCFAPNLCTLIFRFELQRISFIFTQFYLAFLPVIFPVFFFVLRLRFECFKLISQVCDILFMCSRFPLFYISLSLVCSKTGRAYVEVARMSF